jgi:AraC family transcriptional regulator
MAMCEHPESTPAPPQVRYLDLLARAVAYVDAHLDEPLDGQCLATRAAMSRHHFHRIFRAVFGTTVGGYVTWRRLGRACELLAEGQASVLEVAQAVGYESSQALAKAMRRELDTTPTAVRAGASPAWQHLFDRRPPLPAEPPDAPALTPRMVDLPATPVLTATGRGMHEHHLTRAAEQAYGELMPALQAAGLMARVRGCLAAMPDEPRGAEDPDCRILCGVLIDRALGERADGTPEGGGGTQPRPPIELRGTQSRPAIELRGTQSRPAIELRGTLAWLDIGAGRYAVFTHVGPYAELHRTWTAVYRSWVPATGYALRDALPFEHYIDDPRTTPLDALRTDLYVPLR